MINPQAPLACPLDGLALEDHGANWQCAANHHYDLARQGYLNLLPVSQKTSRDPGDTKAMFTARRSAFSSGLFAPAAQALSYQLASRLSPSGDKPAVVLDAGCGEGYYTDHMRAHVTSLSTTIEPVFMGVDISKWGIVAAARLYPQVTWVVGNNKHLPVLPGSVDIITSIFGFETWQPWATLQSAGQRVLVAHAGPLHLLELRELIYDSVNIHSAADDSSAHSAGYEKLKQSAVTYTEPVQSIDTLLQILAMTPHGHRVRADKQAELQSDLARLVNMPLTIDVCCRWYERIA